MGYKSTNLLYLRMFKFKIIRKHCKLHKAACTGSIVQCTHRDNIITELI
jgi:hypothetical protein